MLFTIEMEHSVSQFSAEAQSVNCICVPSNGGQEQSPVEPSFFGHTISRDSPLLSMSRGRGRQASVSASAGNSTGVSVKKWEALKHYYYIMAYPNCLGYVIWLSKTSVHRIGVT